MGRGNNQGGETGGCVSCRVRRSPYGMQGVKASVDSAGGMALDEKRVNVGAFGLCRRGTTAPFDVFIVNLDAGSYLCLTPDKALEKAEKETKDR